MTPEYKLRSYWFYFCDADLDKVPDGFESEMEASGLIELRPVTQDDIDDDCFASARGIELGGKLWELTPAGLAALSASEKE